jgi:hypothetical protein
MILVDANLLLYAKIQDYHQHQRARQWLDQVLSEPARVGLPWQSILAFLRISTNARLFPRPLAISEAWRQIVEWLSLPQVWIPTPGDRHQDVFAELLQDNAVMAGLVMDAHLAALALEHGLLLCSTDGDFARFSHLRWLNPLRTS